MNSNQDQLINLLNKLRDVGQQFLILLGLQTQSNNIKTWSFLNGTIKLQTILQGHNDSIRCLIYSQKQNSFVADDNTIRY
ncbi:unnamed protein product [Paramecium pentaurelia]|uniref:Uncharacterized protein n=1 Tax=Paramecium pentaurelia TaxID=43138 RepID=A0A8S1XBK0_9CILI|nr:unnamed protein product [Paramecium pentaurelia]